MLRIRLRRTGKKNKPQYRIVVAEHKMAIQGKFIDRVGHYNPESKDLVLDKEKVLDWINNGAKPTNTVAKLMKQAKITHPNATVIVFPKKAPKTEKDKEPKVKPAEGQNPEAKTEENVAETKEATAETTETPSETTPDKAENQAQVDNNQVDKKEQ